MLGVGWGGRGGMGKGEGQCEDGSTNSSKPTSVQVLVVVV